MAGAGFLPEQCRGPTLLCPANIWFPYLPTEPLVLHTGLQQPGLCLLGDGDSPGTRRGQRDGPTAAAAPPGLAGGCLACEVIPAGTRHQRGSELVAGQHRPAASPGDAEASPWDAVVLGSVGAGVSAGQSFLPSSARFLQQE